jgi:hypothetical protein
MISEKIVELVGRLFLMLTVNKFVLIFKVIYI